MSSKTPATKAKQLAKPASNGAPTKKENHPKTKKSTPKARVHRASENEYVQDVQRIQGGITTPGLFPPVRFSSEYATSETAIASPWMRVQNVFQESGSNYPSTQATGFLFRDVLRNSVIWDGTASNCNYNLHMYNLTTGSQALPTDSIAVSYIDGSFRNLPVAYASTSDSYQPHGPILFPGMDGETERDYLWLDTGSEFNLAFVGLTGADTGVSVTCNFIAYNNAQPKVVQTNTGAAAQNFNLTLSASHASDYFAVEIQVSAAKNYLMTAAIVITGDGVWCHKPVPGFISNFPTVDAIRILGCSLMLQNQTAMLYKQGRITALQVPEGVPWTRFCVTTGAYDLISTSNGAWNDKLDKGGYGFLNITKPADMDMIADMVKNASGDILSAKFPLKNRSAYLAIATEVDVSTADQPQNYYWQINLSIEFQTTDTWRPVDKPDVPSDVYRIAIEGLKGVPQFHENPSHIKEIWNKIKSFANKAIGYFRRYVPIAMNVVDKVAPLLV